MNSKEKIGVVICDRESPNPHSFKIQLKKEYTEKVKIDDLVFVEDQGKKTIGTVKSVHPYNLHYQSPIAVGDSLAKNYELWKETPDTSSWNIAIAETLGRLEKEKIKFLGDTVKVGREVYKLPEKEIEQILNIKEEGILFGKLFTNPSVTVILDPDITVKEHTLTFGVTRFGKSYTNAVIVEELANQKLPVVIIDPHGEYYSFKESNKEESEIKNLPEKRKPQGFSTVVYSPYMFRDPEKEKLLNVSFSELSASEIVELTKVEGENQIAVIYETVRRLSGRDYSVDDFITELDVTKDDLEISAATQSVSARLRVLQRGIGVFGTGFKPKELVKENQITVINLSGMDLLAQRVTVTCLLRRLFTEKQYGNIPAFALMVDELQRFAPEHGNISSKNIIEEIVREGLKFGVSLHGIAQRPTEVSNAIRSESATKIFHRLTETSEVYYASAILQATSPELAKTIPKLDKGEAIVIGGCTNYFPIRVNVRPRQSKHAGRTGGFLRRRQRENSVQSETLHPYRTSTMNQGNDNESDDSR